MGPPGAGKGTVALEVAQKLNIPHVSTGEILRNAIKSKTVLGKKVETIVNEGKLVSDELMTSLIKEKIDQDCRDGLILDGFPRTETQAKALDTILEVQGIIYLDVCDETVIKRISGRRTNPKTGKIYNIYFNKPKVEDKCDETGDHLIQREDDKLETVEKRLKAFHAHTDIVLAYYEKTGLLRKIDGEKSQEDVKHSVFNAIDDLKNQA